MKNILTNKKNKTTLEGCLKVINDLMPKFENLEKWTVENINQIISNYSIENEVKIGYSMWPIRIGVTGETVTPGGAGEMMFILGKSECLSRLQKTANRIKEAI